MVYHTMGAVKAVFFDLHKLKHLDVNVNTDNLRLNMDVSNKFDLNVVPNDVWPLIVGRDWQVYRGLLGVVNFARLVMKDPAKWRKLFIIESSCGGHIKWTLAGLLHQEDDKPAVVYSNGDREWHRYGKLHRDGDQPAIIKVNGGKKWYQHGKLHRDNDLPAFIDAHGNQNWYQHDELHREGDQPAVICDGSKQWYFHGKRHRDNDLPAITWPFNQQERWVNGVRYVNITDLCDHIWSQIIGNDWQVYAGLLAIPKFARCMMLNPLRWRKLLTIKKQHESGIIEWTLCGKSHRDDGLPAIIYPDGSQKWYQFGRLYRNYKLPAIIYTNEVQAQIRRYEEDRDGDLPAIIYASGDQEWHYQEWRNHEWWIRCKRHREREIR